jgi:hypothetical protein
MQPMLGRILYAGTLVKSRKMGYLSTARKIGSMTRGAAKHASRSRTLGATIKAGRAAASHWGKALNQLWLEVTGFVFLALAAIGLLSFGREVVHYQTGQSTKQRVLAAILFTIMFTWFGISSFWQVRKKKRS